MLIAAGCEVQQRDKLEDEHTYGREREPFDLLPQLAAACPVPDDKRHGCHRQEHDEQHRQAVKGPDEDRGEDGAERFDAERVLDRQRDTAGCGKRHQPWCHDEADQRRRSRQEA